MMMNATSLVEGGRAIGALYGKAEESWPPPARRPILADELAKT